MKPKNLIGNEMKQKKNLMGNKMKQKNLYW